MPEAINEPISVALWSNHITRKIIPYSLYWHGRRYQIKNVGLHHTYRQGRILIHVFSVTDGVSFFRLEMNGDTLEWRLLEVETVH
jgi:hypothetical protein